jgi:cell wall-associated NlpC family hydrolase
MASSLRLPLLALVIAYALAVAPISILAAHTTAKRQKAFRVRAHGWSWPGIERLAHRTTLGEQAVRYAKRFLGVPYRWGGSSPSSGFDCSGLVRYVFERFGVDLPHSSYADFGLGRRVPRESLRPGDLVFFDGIGHVGMYVGGGRFIHSPHSGTPVQISSLHSYGSSYDGARRVVEGARRLVRR